MKKFFAVLLISILAISTSINIILSTESDSSSKETKYNDNLSSLDEPLNQENYNQTVYTELEELSSVENLSITPLESINSIQSAITYEKVEYWLLNFTYLKDYQSTSHQEDTHGFIQYNLNQTITTSVFASMPIVLATYQNDSVSANDHTQIITQAIVDDNYQGFMGFSFNFDLDYYFKAQIAGIGPVIGPGKSSLPFTRKWIFPTPMNGKLVLEKVGFSFPLVIPLLNIGISAGPKIDTDFSAKTKTNDTDIMLSNEILSWTQNGAIQSLSLDIPEFCPNDAVITDLFDFDMEFVLSLAFYLDIRIGLPIFNIPFSFEIFSFPVATTHLFPENIDLISLEHAITPTDDLPFVYGVGYNFSDTAGDNDGILEPGDIVDFSTLITNLGDGSAIEVNSTATSTNVTVSGKDQTAVLLKNQGNYDLHSGFQFSIPSDYSGRYILVNMNFEYWAVNGSFETSSYELYFTIVHLGDPYLEVSNVFIDHPGDYWKSGDNLGIYFNVTNRGAENIQNATIYVIDAFDTDTINTATLVNDITNSSDLTIGSSTILGFVNLSSPIAHDDGLIYLYVYVHYENTTHIFNDLFYFTVPIFSPKPLIDVISSVGYDANLDGIFEAGETLNITFTFQNTGDGNAHSITGYLTSDNPDLNITQPHIYVGGLGVSAVQPSTNATIEIPITARNQTTNFILHIHYFDSKDHEFYDKFLIQMNITEQPLPILTLLSYSIDDSLLGNDNGIPDPGEIFLLYINAQIDNFGSSVTGSANTSSELFFYNDSSSYGDLSNQVASGDGFVVEVPMNFLGGTTRIDVTLFAESYSGRKINATGYLELSIDTGDISAPSMTLEDIIPEKIIQNNELSFSINVQDPSVTNEIKSGIDRVLLIWMFNNGDIQLTEISDPNTDGSYDIELDTSTLGTYYFIPVAIDKAGNIQFIPKNNDVFEVEVVSSSTSTTATSTTTSAASFSTIFIALALVLLTVVWRMNKNYYKKKRC